MQDRLRHAHIEAMSVWKKLKDLRKVDELFTVIDLALFTNDHSVNIHSQYRDTLAFLTISVPVV